MDESLCEKMDLHKFAPCKRVAKNAKTKEKSGAKMINGTFAYQNHRIVINETNVECAIFSPIAPKFS